jgi:hypothetical protein
MSETSIPDPSVEEIDKLRKDASEGDPNAAAALKPGPDAEKSLRKWREAQLDAEQ